MSRAHQPSWDRAHIKFKRGTQLPQSRLTEDDVKLIRELAKSGMKFRTIGEKFDIHHTTAWRVANYLDWKHVRD